MLQQQCITTQFYNNSQTTASASLGLHSSALLMHHLPKRVSTVAVEPHNSVLQTKVDAQCDKLATAIGQTKFATLGTKAENLAKFKFRQTDGIAVASTPLAMRALQCAVKNQLDPSSRFKRTPACDRDTDIKPQHIPC